MTKKEASVKRFLRVGFSKIDITPAGSLEMGGYIARKEPATGSHDPLFVKALSFQNEEAAALLLSFDLLHLSSEWCRRLKKRIEEKLAIPADHILMGATHTHSGPAVFFPAAGQNEALAAYEDLLAAASLQAAEQAVSAGEPAVLRESSGSMGLIARNRCDLFKLSDDRLSVVRIETPKGKIRGHLVSFSCHPTVMSAENLQYSADLFGCAASLVERRSENTFCLMFNGAAGDLSTRFARKRQSWEELERLGKKLARQILELSRGSESIQTSVIAAKTREMRIPFRPILPVEEAQRKYDACKQALSDRSGLNLQNLVDQMRVRYAHFEGASAQLLLSRLGGWTPLFGVNEADVFLHVLRIGDLIFCGLPGEFFGQRGIELARAAHPKRGIVIGYANGYWGYLVPPKEALDGGYEAMMAPLDAKEEPKIVGQLKALIKEAKGMSRRKRDA